MLVQAPSEHSPGLQVEVAGLPAAAAQGVLTELDELRARLNVYRGHLFDSTQGVTRSLLGVGNDPDSLPAGAAPPPMPRPVGQSFGWTAYGPMHRRPRRG